MTLSNKQRLFVEEYIIDLNATQAAVRAGYSEKTAYSQGQRLLKNVEIQTALKERMENKKSDLIMKQDEILQRLTKQARREETEFKVVTLKSKVISDGVIEEDDRVEIVQLPTSNSDAIKALELLGKRYAMWTDRQQIDGETLVRFEYNFGDDDDVEDD